MLYPLKVEYGACKTRLNKYIYFNSGLAGGTKIKDLHTNLKYFNRNEIFCISHEFLWLTLLLDLDFCDMALAKYGYEVSQIESMIKQLSLMHNQS